MLVSDNEKKKTFLPVIPCMIDITLTPDKAKYMYIENI